MTIANLYLKARPMILLVFVFLVLNSLVLQAESGPRPLPVEELVSGLSLSRSVASLSPDGRLLAYTVQDPQKVHVTDDMPFFSEVFRDGIVGSDIWITDTETGVSTNVTGGIGANWAPVWSPDGKMLAFYSTRSREPAVWAYERSGGRIREISDAVVRAIDPWQIVIWTQDSKKIVVKIASENAQVDPDPKTGHGSAALSPAPDVTVYGRVSRGAQDEHGNDNVLSLQDDSRSRAERGDLAIIDVQSGKSERVTRGITPVWYSLSPDGSRLALATWKGLPGGNRLRNIFDISILENGALKVLASNIESNFWDLKASWSPDGRWLSYIAGWSGSLSDADCYLISVHDGVVRKATEEPHPTLVAYARWPPTWDSRGNNLYLLGAQNSLWRISTSDRKVKEIVRFSDRQLMSIVGDRDAGRFWSPDGNSMIVTFLDAATEQYGFSRIDLNNGKSVEMRRENKKWDINYPTLYSSARKALIYEAEDAGHEPNYWMTGGDCRSSKLLTNVNPKLDQYEMGRSKLVEWKSLDGKPLRGALLLPSGYQSGRKYPLIVSVYGGISGASLLNCFGLYGAYYPIENRQLLATRGYAVLVPDAPLEVGKALAGLGKTVLPGINQLVDIGIADPDRIGIMGQSYGGYSTLALLVQSSRFKAAVMLAGYGDVEAFSGEMNSDGSSLGSIVEYPLFGGSMPGPAWVYPENYVENSPVFYLDRVETPLLIVHGANDRSVSSFLSDEVFVFLRRLGKEVVYAKYRNEGHAFLGYADQIDYCNRMIAWFDSHLWSGEVKEAREGSSRDTTTSKW